jgi:hypothetical protein
VKYLIGAACGAVVALAAGYLWLAWYFRNVFRG